MNSITYTYSSYWWFQELTTLIFIHTLSSLIWKIKFWYFFNNLFWYSFPNLSYPPFFPISPLFGIPSHFIDFFVSLPICLWSCRGKWNYVMDRVFDRGLLKEFSMKLEGYELEFLNLFILLKLGYTLPVMSTEWKWSLSAIRRLRTRMPPFNWKIRFIHDNEDTFKKKIES